MLHRCCPPSRCRRSLTPGESGQGIERQLALVTLAHEHPERPLALAPIRGWRLEAAAQQRHRAIQLTLGVGAGERRLGHLALDSPSDQAAPDPLRAPAFQFALVLGEQAGEAGIVELAPFTEQPQNLLDRLRLHSLGLQVAANLLDAVLTTVD